MAYQLGLLTGDDIGLEVVPAAHAVVAEAMRLHGIDVDWHELPVGMVAFQELGATLPAGTMERLADLDGWILGPIGHRDYPDHPAAVNPHPIIRKHFGLFANIRPARSHPAVPGLHEGVDLVIVRENNEGFQPDRNVVAGSGEFRPNDGMTISVRVITREASANVARAAFELASRRSHKVVAVHKNTVFKLGCGMFAEECRLVAAEYPDVEYSEAIVDTFAMQLAMRPQRYDVVVTTNMFGDILSDLAAGLVGGLGLASGLSAGFEHAMAQATHGSAPDIAGRGIANPTAMIASGALLLDWLSRRHSDPRMEAAAHMVNTVLDTTLTNPATHTPDLGGDATTDTMTQYVLEGMRSLAKAGAATADVIDAGSLKDG